MSPKLPVRFDGLTEKQVDFVKWLARNVPQGRAAALAGYECADQAASRLVKQANIQAALAQEIAATQNTAFVTLGANLGVNILRNPGAYPVPMQVVAFKASLARIDRICDTAATKKMDRGAGSVTAAELEEMALEIRAGRAKVIDNDPNDTQTSEPDPEDIW